MPAIIDSAPDCIVSQEVNGSDEASVSASADDSADAVLQDNYQECAGFMTFGPGSTYGEDGQSAATAYYFLTWIGAAVIVACLIAWVVLENKRLVEQALRARR